MFHKDQTMMIALPPYSNPPSPTPPSSLTHFGDGDKDDDDDDEDRS